MDKSQAGKKEVAAEISGLFLSSETLCIPINPIWGFGRLEAIKDSHPSRWFVMLLLSVIRGIVKPLSHYW